MSSRQHVLKQATSNKYIIGIDEVGRGALAGPVTVAAACIPHNLHIRNHGWGNLKDSKKLSPAQRKRWFAYFKNQPALCYNIARVYPRGIERLNISKAANRAATLACGRLARVCKLKIKNCKIFLDGGLYLETKRGHTRNERACLPAGRDLHGKKFQRLSAPALRRAERSGQHWSATTVVRGDEKIPAIAVASIIAKVSRDGYMKRLSKRYPRYGFEIHKGYGTKRHMAAIRRYGPSKVHRLTFLEKYHKINA